MRKKSSSAKTSPLPNSEPPTSEKRPRQYAAEYVKLPTKRERALYWQTIPEELRGMVRVYAGMWRERHELLQRV